MPLSTLLPHLIPIDDAYEESFSLFLHKPHSKSLGFVSRTSSTLPLEIPPYTLHITQSPGLLNSSLPGGTTGAVLWSVTPRLARWLCAPNILTQHGIFTPQTRVLELGAGVGAVLGCTVGRSTKWWGCSDMPYVLKGARENIAANLPAAGAAKRRGRGVVVEGVVETVELDWEQDVIAEIPEIKRVGGVDVVVAADCVYNEGLVGGFVAACADACKVGEAETVVVVAQELRSQDVFECWLEGFAERFRMWRVPDEVCGEELGAKKGFVVHIGILRREGDVEKEEEEEQL